MAAAATRAKVAEGRARYQALVNLSIPQVSDSGMLTGQNDLIPRGEIVELDERQAANLMACGPRHGRTVPAIRPAAEAKGDLPRLLPRQLSGPLRQPPPPPDGSDAPRPDPPGASRILVQQPPESTEPMPGSEATGGQEGHPWEVAGGTIDIKPGTARVG
jgi:hypothetical protein